MKTLLSAMLASAFLTLSACGGTGGNQQSDAGQIDPGQDAGTPPDAGTGETDPGNHVLTPANRASMADACGKANWFVVQDTPGLGEELRGKVDTFCGTSPTVGNIAMTADGSSISNSLVISVGGPYFNPITSRAEAFSPVIFHSDDGITGDFWTANRPFQSVVIADMGPTEDYLLSQLGADPAGNNIFLTVYGVSAEGSAAAVKHFKADTLGTFRLEHWNGTTDLTTVVKED